MASAERHARRRCERQILRSAAERGDMRAMRDARGKRYSRGNCRASAHHAEHRHPPAVNTHTTTSRDDAQAAGAALLRAAVPRCHATVFRDMPRAAMPLRHEAGVVVLRDTACRRAHAFTVSAAMLRQ